MSNRKGRKSADKFIHLALVQIQRKDYHPSDALRSLVRCSLDLQPGLQSYLDSIIPPKTDPEAFILEGLQEGYFQFLDEGEEVWLCRCEDNGSVRKIV
jgi:hypothetical protein